MKMQQAQALKPLKTEILSFKSMKRTVHYVTL